ncbi:MAG TPA: hypothetical protein VKZ50_11535 [bacterium]|nr:hypothetical protein [bacterium]
MPGGDDAGETVPVSPAHQDDSTDPARVTFLAAALDDEVVLLDLVRGQLVLLDPAAARVWRACDIPATSFSGSAGRRAAGILRRLANARAVVRHGDRWACAPVRWV